MSYMHEMLRSRLGTQQIISYYLKRKMQESSKRELVFPMKATDSGF